MLSSVRSFVLAGLLALGWLIAAAPAAQNVEAIPLKGVEDRARLFSEAAVGRARKEIAEIKGATKKDLVVETFPTAPAKYKGKDRTSFAKEWARENFKAHGVDGVYVLICKEPRFLQVVVGNVTNQRGIFTNAERDGLAEVLLAKMRESSKAEGADKARALRDEALLAGVAYVRRHLGPQVPFNGVKDAVGFFSADAVARARKQINELKRATKKDLVIETISSPPKRYEIDKAATSVDEWATAMFKKHKIDGIYVLMCDIPHLLRIVVGEDLRSRGQFTDANRDALRDLLLAKLKASAVAKKQGGADAEKQAAGLRDEALLEGVAYVRRTLAKAPPLAPVEPAPKPAPQDGRLRDRALPVGLAIPSGSALGARIPRGVPKPCQVPYYEG